MTLQRGCRKTRFAICRFPAALLGCDTRHLYASNYVAQLPGSLYENVTYDSMKVSVVEALFRTSFCTKTSTRFCTECGLAQRNAFDLIIFKSTPSDNGHLLEFAIEISFEPAHQWQHGYWYEVTQWEKRSFIRFYGKLKQTSVVTWCAFKDNWIL